MWPFRKGHHWATLEKIECPTLCFTRGYTFIRGEVMESMAHALSNSTLHDVANAGHVVPVDNPAALVELLEDFLPPG